MCNEVHNTIRQSPRPCQDCDWFPPARIDTSGDRYYPSIKGGVCDACLDDRAAISANLRAWVKPLTQAINDSRLSTRLLSLITLTRRETMNNELNNIKRYHRVIDNALFYVRRRSSMIGGQWVATIIEPDYDRVTDAIISLSNAVHDYDGDTMDVWDIGEGGQSTVSELIVGAYWHYTEWHSGQWSKGYAALSALGQVFNPGMTMPETENEAYLALNDKAAS